MFHGQWPVDPRSTVGTYQDAQSSDDQRLSDRVLQFSITWHVRSKLVRPRDFIARFRSNGTSICLNAAQPFRFILVFYLGFGLIFLYKHTYNGLGHSFDFFSVLNKRHSKD